MKNILLLFAAFCLTIVGNAQTMTYSGNDVNLDGNVDISDVNHAISEICGFGESELVVSVDSLCSYVSSIHPEVAKQLKRKLGLSNEPETPEHEYVEIGGVKWATMNLGATTVAGDPSTCYGDYFAWGETEPRYTSITISGENSVSFGGWRSDHTSGYYSYSDNLTYTSPKLDADHDAATQNWGDDWRTPTMADYEALINACNGARPSLISTSAPTGGTYWLPSDQTYLPEYSGVAGTLFVDNTDTSKRVFFPAAGYCYYTRFYKGGSRSDYWLSSLNILTNWPICGEMAENYSVTTEMHSFEGYTIRPVLNTDKDKSETEQLVTSITLSSSSLTLTIGDMTTDRAILSTTVEPSNASCKSLVWASDNEDVARVIRGVVYAKGEGTAIITCAAIDGSGVTATCIVTVTDPPLDDPNLIPGKFSVSATKKVQFSKSNLYWDGSEFRFEETQIDNPSGSYYFNPNHVSAFWWTILPDYQSGNPAYMPYAEGFACSSHTNDTFWCGEDNPLTVEGTSGLYVLTSQELIYLIKSRKNASNLYKLGVRVTNGDDISSDCLIFAPDGFTGTLQSSYTVDELNAAGLVCFPNAGYREGGDYYVAGNGYYWTSTTIINKYTSNHNAAYLYFAENTLHPDSEEYRLNAFYIRLVK